MTRGKVTVHMMVKNEDRFIWYAVSSILPFADKIHIIDTGSTDATLDIIRTFHDEKIIIEIYKVKVVSDVTKVRQYQIDQTKTEWLWIVDGDEIYTHFLGREIRSKLNDKNIEGIVVGRYDLLGDIYHYQSESVGTYNTFGKKGHCVLRLLHKDNINRLHVDGVYPYEGYYDENNNEVLNHEKQKYYFTKGRLYHAMYLQRSTLGINLSDTFHRMKGKVEIGKKFPESQKFPEVFSMARPSNVVSVSSPRSVFYEIMASAITPFKILKRTLWRVISENSNS